MNLNPLPKNKTYHKRRRGRNDPPAERKRRPDLLDLDEVLLLVSTLQKAKDFSEHTVLVDELHAPIIRNHLTDVGCKFSSTDLPDSITSLCVHLVAPVTAPKGTGALSNLELFADEISEEEAGPYPERLTKRTARIKNKMQPPRKKKGTT